ncbi:MAG: sterol desaturase family protein [Myxococcota bacterium]
MTQLEDALVDLAIAVVAMIAVFVPLERVLPARPQGHVRPGLSLDVTFLIFQYLVMVGVMVWFNSRLQLFLGPLGPAAMVKRVHALPVVLQVLLVTVLGDVLLYWAHRACHVFPLLWRFHAVHHSSTHLDWIAAHREHPLDGLYSQLWLNLPAVVLGVDVTAVGPLLVLRSLCAVFVHSNVRVDLGWVGLLLGDPVLHRWHHARADHCRHNFANLAPYLDIIFGTHHRPLDENYPLGVTESVPRGFLRQLLHPLIPSPFLTSDAPRSTSANPGPPPKLMPPPFRAEAVVTAPGTGTP